MGSVKETLYQTIEQLSEEHARQTLEYVQRLQRTHNSQRLYRRLAAHPAFRLPAGDLGPFDAVEPIQGRGVEASELLIKDRR